MISKGLCVLLVALAILQRSPLALAHQFDRVFVPIVGLGASGDFTIVDASGCYAWVTARSLDPTVATVAPAGPINVVTQTFTVTAGTTSVGPVLIEIRWSGSGESTSGDDPNCNEIGTRLIEVEVVDYRETTSSNGPSSGVEGDPVNMHNGELFFHDVADLQLGGPFPLRFQRYYGSRLRLDFVVGAMGDNWRHNYEWDIHVVGNVAVLVDPEGRVLRYLKNSVNGPWELQNNTDVGHSLRQFNGNFHVLDPRTNYIYTFDAPPQHSALKLVTIDDSRGNQHTLTYDDRGMLESVTDGLGRTLSVEHNAAPIPKVSGVSDGARAVTFAYDGEELTHVTDAGGATTEFVYDRDHRDPALLLRRIRPTGRAPLRQSWDVLGRVLSQTDASGHSTTFSYGPERTLVRHPDNTTEEYWHGDDGALVKHLDGLGGATRITTDEVGRRIAVSDKVGGATATSYQEDGAEVSLADSLGNESRKVVVERIHPSGFALRDTSEVQYPDGSSRKVVYDGNGYARERIDESGNRWLFTYNERGQVLSAQNPLGGMLAFAYDASGNLVAETDAFGNQTQYEYDQADRLRLIRFADGTARQFVYSVSGLLESFTDERGSTTRTEFDDDGHVTKITDPAGNQIDFEYDENGHRSSVTDRNRARTIFTFDPRGLLSQRTEADGKTLRYQYDAAGHLRSVVDDDGDRWTVEPDANGRPVLTVAPSGTEIVYDTDSEGRIISMTRGEGVFGFTYDKRGRLRASTDEEGQTTTYEYTANGWLESMKMPLGQRARYERNGLNQLTGIIDPRGARWVTRYDRQGRMSETVDPLKRQTFYEYDARNRIAVVTYPGELGRLSIEYNESGHATRRRYSDGTELNYTYDELGRLAQLTGVQLAFDGESHLIESNGITNLRDVSSGQVSLMTLAPGKTITYERDSRGQVIRIVDWLGGTTRLSYTADGRVSEQVRSNGTSTRTRYDGHGRVKEIDNGPLARLTLERDKRGYVNRALREGLAVYKEDPGRRDLRTDAAYQIEGIQFDSLGRVIDDGDRQYRWDLASRLLAYVEGDALTEFAYDGFGHLVRRETSSESRSYVWNYATDFPVISLERINGIDVRYYVHTPGGTLLYSVDAATGERVHYHFDEVGNTHFLTGETGALIASYAYDAYGAMLRSGEERENPFTFAGQFGVMQANEGALFFMRQRVYDSRTMRFLSRDPISHHIHPRTINPYQYAGGDPRSFVDPVGMDVTATEVAVEITTQTRNVTRLADIPRAVVQGRADIANGIIELAETVEKAANDTFNPEEMFSINGATQSIKATGQAKQNAELINKVNGIANGTTMKAVGFIGSGAQAVCTGIELNKLKDRLGEVLEDYSERTRRAFRLAHEQTVNALELYAKKRITWPTLRLFLVRIDLELKREIFLSDWSYDIEFLLGAWTAYGNGLGGFVPFFPGFSDEGNQSLHRAMPDFLVIGR